MNTPHLSVAMLAYNHESFIRKAIEGVLSQETSFSFRLVIGDDCSSDSTGDIVVAMQQNFPSQIDYFRNGSNLGLYGNAREVFRRCTGKYVAICEGDDFWTHPDKLQKQVDFLEANPEFSACFHDAEVVYLNREKASHSLIRDKRDVFSFEDVIAKSFSVPTCSLLFRNEPMGFPEELPLLDWVILLLLAKRGKLKRLDGTMAVYHQHAAGWTNKNWTQKAQELVAITRLCRKHFGPEHEKDFDRILAHDLADVCFGYFQDGNTEKFLLSYGEISRLKHLLSSRKRIALDFRKRLAIIPPIARFYSNLANRYREFVFLHRDEF